MLNGGKHVVYDRFLSAKRLISVNRCQNPMASRSTTFCSPMNQTYSGASAARGAEPANGVVSRYLTS